MTGVDRLVAEPPGVWRRIGDEVRAAASFLTRVPVGSGAITSATTGAAAFGLVGAGVGAVAAIPMLVLGQAAPIAAGGVALGTLAMVSGALHLDGLADTADALAAPTIEASARARKDPAVGAAGASAIALVLIVDVGLLAALAARLGPPIAALALVACAAASRAVPVLAVAAPLGRSSSAGLGAWFAERTGAASAIFAAGSALALALLAAATSTRPGLLVGPVVGAGFGLLVARWLAGVRAGLDGDGLGALVEIAFAAMLVLTVVAT